MGLLFAYSITGAVIVEIVFSWPGMGGYMAEAIVNSDIYVLFAVTLVVTLIYIIINLILDVIQSALDPRVRLGEDGDI
jgi:peptide/nickel transport system permease protein